MADKERRKRKPLTEEQKQKIREATKRAMQRPDVRAKYEASRKEAVKMAVQQLFQDLMFKLKLNKLI